MKLSQKTLKQDLRFLPIKLKNMGLATYASWKYGRPHKGMRMVGITGTDGKTTTTNLTYAILKADGRKVGIVSTLGALIDGQESAIGLHVSTPGPVEIFQLLSRMKKAGVTDVILEVTSHALDQRRIYGIKFDVAVLTNITPEHLDYHITFERYVAAKRRLFTMAKLAVINGQDASAPSIARIARKVWRYGIDLPDASIGAEDVQMGPLGSEFTVNFGPDVPKLNGRRENFKVNLPSDYNVMNSLAAIGATAALGASVEAMRSGLQTVRALTGRFEIIQQEPFAVVVDFAHTAHAFEEVLPAARALVKPGGKLYHLFGSAAERDTVKRVDMGRISGELADFTVLTADDPRHESLDKIQAMLLEGLLPTGKQEGTGWTRIDDRQKAIRWVINRAKPGDVVLLAGKGHEKTLAVGGQEIPWSDQEEAREALRLRKEQYSGVPL